MMASHKAFAKGFAGMWTKGRMCEPWGRMHLGQPVASQPFDNGKLWTFGSATATWEPYGSTFRFVGRPFHAGDRTVTPVTPVTPVRDATSLKTVLAELDGRFSVFCSLPTGDTVVATDWLGLGPLFVAELSGSVYFASHLGLLVDLLEELPPLDHLGVASILAGATMIGGRTPYLGVCRLMAGQMATISANHSVRLSIQQYVDPLEMLTANRADGSDIDDQFDHLLQAAVRREGVDPEKWVLMLSGGRDSRALAYVLSEQCHDPVRAATFGRPSSTDMRVAKRTAYELRFRHTPISYENWTLHDEASFVTGLSGGASGLQAALFVVPFRAVADRAEVAMTGFLGDAITGAHLDGPPCDRLAMSRLAEWKAPVEESYSEELGVIRAALGQTETHLNALSPHQRSLFIDFTVRQATWISQSFSLCSWFVDLSAPFVHRDLMSFLFGLPEEHLRGQALYDRWLTRSARRLERSPRFTSAVTNRMAALTSLGRRAVCRGFGVNSPETVVNWSEMHRVSAKWFDESIRDFEEDARLRGVAEFELLALRRTSRIPRFSPLLLALGIMRPWIDRRAPRPSVVSSAV